MQDSLILKDILVGEVWLAGGQSNMQFRLDKEKNWDKYKDSIDNKSIRYLFVPQKYYEGHTVKDSIFIWRDAVKDKAKKMSAVAYFFAKELYSKLNVPIGIICDYKGGTPAESWISRETLIDNEKLKSIVEEYECLTDSYSENEYETLYANYLGNLESYNKAVKKGDSNIVKPVEPMGKFNYKRPYGLYETMLKPIMPYTVKGVIWYQGEANASRAEQYKELFPVEVFVKNITQKKTFVALKTATTLDGKVATRTGSSKWITNEKSRAYVQKLRNKYDGILTSASTVLADNPALTCRMDGGRNPVRIILDKDGIVPIDYKVFEDNSTRVVVCQKSGLKKDYPSYVDVLECPVKDNHLDLKYVISQLYEMQIFSVMVEAGGILNGAFLKEGLIDKFYQFIAPKIIGDERAKSFVSGLDIEDVSNCIELVPKHLHFFDKDVIIEACVE